MAPPTKTHSGRLNVRLPVELHAELAAEAERQGVSLNTLIVALLAGGIGWKQP
jgi:predicted HicB family RNase H-like nuclease